jgi:hypothetical protein
MIFSPFSKVFFPAVLVGDCAVSSGFLLRLLPWSVRSFLLSDHDFHPPFDTLIGCIAEKL